MNARLGFSFSSCFKTGLRINKMGNLTLFDEIPHDLTVTDKGLKVSKCIKGCKSITSSQVQNCQANTMGSDRAGVK